MPAVASVLAAYSQLPLLALDGRGSVILANEPAERLLGLRHGAALGQSLAELCVPAEEREQVEQSLKRARAGSLKRAEWVVTTAEQRTLSLSVELSATGHGRRASVVVAVLGSRERTPNPRLRMGLAEACYEISARPGAPFIIQNVSLREGRPDKGPSVVGKVCYEALAQRDSICPGCPILSFASNPQVTYQVSVVASHGANAELVLMGVERTEEHLFRVSYQPIREPLLSYLTKTRLDQLAARAGLSEREREVLDLIVMGRTADEIGTILGISARTAKYHQANLLEKLGADSRLDLLRLLI
ncbi:MAG: PAS domain-containing protein [Deltaproteobacteria bacterium]|nr:PAS domain-containing protein [Deltaproteobacteria bacterium]